MTVYAFLEQRRSIRQYLDREVEPDRLLRVAQAAALAPTAHHSTPWHVAIATAPAVKRQVAQAMAMAWAADMEAEGVPASVRTMRAARSEERFAGAPALLMTSLDSRLVPAGESQQSRYEEILMIQSVAAAVYAMLLAAAAEGLGAAWISAPLFCPDPVRGALGLADFLVPQALITLGYPGAVPGPRPPRAVESAIVWVR